MWNLEHRALESGIDLTESEIPTTMLLTLYIPIFPMLLYKLCPESFSLHYEEAKATSK